MKRKNPYLWFTIIWVLCTALNLTLSVVRFVSGEIGLGILLCCLAVGFSFGAGGLFAKWLEIAEWNKAVHFVEQAHEALDNFIEELKKEEENRPFKEFDAPSDVPFPEVRGKNDEDE